MCVTSNLLTIANNINRDSFHFRITTDSSGLQILQENSYLREWFSRLCFSRQSHENALKSLIAKNVQAFSTISRSIFIDYTTREVMQLFIEIQKYNEVLEKTKKFTHTLGSKLQLNFVQNPKVLEFNPSKLSVSETRDVHESLREDKPTTVEESRFFRKHKIRRYPGDSIDHSVEAGHIFKNTQIERFLSFVGRIFEAVAGIFGFKLTSFQKYHYRKWGETDAEIYAKPINPISNTPLDPTVYWKGHASLIWNVPLISKSGLARASFRVGADYVEGHLSRVLYPRQTKCPLSLEEGPEEDIYTTSHNHLDHWEESTLIKLLAKQTPIIVPLGDKKRLSTLAHKYGYSDEKVFELDWWQTKTFTFEKNGETYELEIAAVPARHWSGQGPCGGHESTFLGYVIRGHEKGDIYFAGDTARLNSDHIEKLTKHFNIKWSFQPGGPDEVREDMESTHQSSADGLWMHVSLIIPKIYTARMQLETFRKTFLEHLLYFDHTMTFKLGNLHLSDTRDSIAKVLTALETDETSSSELKDYEMQVYRELCKIADDLEFSRGEKLTHSAFADLLRQTTIVPKIGSRIDLGQSKSTQLESVYF